MKYQVIRDCMIKGTVHRVGDVVDLDKEVATQLLAIGRVAPHDESQTENRSVALEVSDQKPKRRGRPKKVVEQSEEPEDG